MDGSFSFIALCNSILYLITSVNYINNKHILHQIYLNYVKYDQFVSCKYTSDSYSTVWQNEPAHALLVMLQDLKRYLLQGGNGKLWNKYRKYCLFIIYVIDVSRLIASHTRIHLHLMIIARYMRRRTTWYSSVQTDIACKLYSVSPLKNVVNVQCAYRLNSDITINLKKVDFE